MSSNSPKTLKNPDITEDMKKELCAWISDGGTLTSWVEEREISGTGKVYSAMRKDPEFREAYEAAQEMAAETMAGEMLDVAREQAAHGDPRKANSVKLLLDTHKWLASRYMPKKFGDRLNVDTKHSGKVTFSIEDGD